MPDTPEEMDLRFQTANNLIRALFGMSAAEVKKRLALIESGGLTNAYRQGWQDCFDAVKQQKKGFNET